MKSVFAGTVFILALGLSIKSVAVDSQTCTSGKTENCEAPRPAAVHSKAAAHESAGGHEEKLGEKMNSLFPQKLRNPVAADTPTTVKLTSPKFLSDVPAGTVKLEWAPAEGASNYHVQVATDPNFKWLVANNAFVKGPSFEANQLEAGRKYYWRVAAIKNQNDAMFTKSLFVSSVFSTK